MEGKSKESEKNERCCKKNCPEPIKDPHDLPSPGTGEQEEGVLRTFVSQLILQCELGNAAHTFRFI